MAKGCVLSTGYLPRGGLSRNSVDRITDRPDMISAVDCGRKTSTQTKQNMYEVAIVFYSVSLCAISPPRTNHSLKYIQVTAFTKNLPHCYRLNVLTAVPYMYVKPLGNFLDRHDVKAKYAIQKIHKYLN